MIDKELRVTILYIEACGIWWGIETNYGYDVFLLYSNKRKRKISPGKTSEESYMAGISMSINRFQYDYPN